MNDEIKRGEKNRPRYQQERSWWGESRKVPLSLVQWTNLRYPQGRVIRFTDSKGRFVGPLLSTLWIIFDKRREYTERCGISLYRPFTPPYIAISPKSPYSSYHQENWGRHLVLLGLAVTSLFTLASLHYISLLLEFFFFFFLLPFIIFYIFGYIIAVSVIYTRIFTI